jgi:signal transduction histidine kinase
MDAPVSSSDTLAKSVLRNRLRRLYWLWWAPSIIIWVAWELVEYFILSRIQLPMEVLLIGLTVAIIVGVLITLITARREDRYLTRMEQLEAERTNIAWALAQAETIRATARTVAHDLNQPLAIARSYAKLLHNTCPAARNESDLARIVAEVDRAADLVQQLLAISSFRTLPYADGTLMLDLGDVTKQ